MAEDDEPVLNKPSSAGNSSAVMVHMHSLTADRTGGQLAHDLRRGAMPNYVAAERTHLNRIIREPWTGTELFREAEQRRALRKLKRRMGSNAGVGTAGLISFGTEAQGIFATLSDETQDIAYLEIAEAIAARLNTTVTGLVVHNDESAPHAHFQMVGYDLNGEPLSQTARRQAMIELQDIAAEVIQRHAPGIQRGRSKRERLDAGADYADVTQKRVKQLHEELPAEIAVKKAELADLEARITEANEALAETERLQTRLSSALATIQLLESRLNALATENERLTAECQRLVDRIAAMDLAAPAAVQSSQNT